MPISAVRASLPTRVLQRPGIREIRISAVPDPGTLREQAESLYRKVFDALAAVDARPEHIVSETVFFRDLFETCGAYMRARQQCHEAASDPHLPPVTYLQQPPCAPDHLFEIQILAVVPEPSAPFTRTAIPGLPTPASGILIEAGGTREVYISGLHGGDVATGFEERTRAAFERAAEALASVGFRFHDVVRTWVYVPDLLGDYDTLNAVRSAFFERERIVRIPASTGIQGAVYPDPVGVGLDLYALQPAPCTRIERMRSTTMNEAPSYGSRFARGMAVVDGAQTLAYLSGTASIDPEGRVAHVGDIRRQLHRMLENVTGLLDSVGADPSSIQCARMYLKDSGNLGVFREAWKSAGFAEDVPCNVVIADVCRPDWLCEVEAVAAVSSEGKDWAD